MAGSWWDLGDLCCRILCGCFIYPPEPVHMQDGLGSPLPCPLSCFKGPNGETKAGKEQKGRKEGSAGGNTLVKCQTCSISGYQWEHQDNLGVCFVVTMIGDAPSLCEQRSQYRDICNMQDSGKELSRTPLNGRMSYKRNACLSTWTWTPTLFYIKREVFSHRFLRLWTLQQGVSPGRTACSWFCLELSKSSSPFWKIFSWGCSGGTKLSEELCCGSHIHGRSVCVCVYTDILIEPWLQKSKRHVIFN